MRVALARAFYARKKLVILDHILAGLDSTTEEEGFSSVLGPQGLLRRQGATVILATNSVHRLSDAEYITALNGDGEIDEIGTFDRLIGNHGYISSLNLAYRKPQAATNVNRLTNLLQGMPQLRTPVDMSETEKNTSGDLTIYKNYIDTFGWGNWTVFTSICL
ncbi:hypothetical protein ABVK25_000532 [Lepraria finkii]|uniref:Uncharacterized protein n=1 Tax=Lepraria finkii TaxID=1340010 RepID=A0ABR4BN87_9LECA